MTHHKSDRSSNVSWFWGSLWSVLVACVSLFITRHLLNKQKEDDPTKPGFTASVGATTFIVSGLLTFVVYYFMKMSSKSYKSHSSTPPIIPSLQ